MSARKRRTLTVNTTESQRTCTATTGDSTVLPSPSRKSRVTRSESFASWAGAPKRHEPHEHVGPAKLSPRHHQSTAQAPVAPTVATATVSTATGASVMTLADMIKEDGRWWEAPHAFPTNDCLHFPGLLHTTREECDWLDWKSAQKLSTLVAIIAAAADYRTMAPLRGAFRNTESSRIVSPSSRNVSSSIGIEYEGTGIESASSGNDHRSPLVGLAASPSQTALIFRHVSLPSAPFYVLAVRSETVLDSGLYPLVKNKLAARELNDHAGGLRRDLSRTMGSYQRSPICRQLSEPFFLVFVIDLRSGTTLTSSLVEVTRWLTSP